MDVDFFNFSSEFFAQMPKTNLRRRHLCAVTPARQSQPASVEPVIQRCVRSYDGKVIFGEKKFGFFCVGDADCRKVFNQRQGRR